MNKNNSVGTVFEANFIHDLHCETSDYNEAIIGVGGQSYGIGGRLGILNEAVNQVVRNNVIINCSGYDSIFYCIGANDCQIYNNTIYNVDVLLSLIWSQPSFTSGDDRYDDGSVSIDITWKNNIFWNCTITDAGKQYLHLYGHSWADRGWIFDYNCIDDTTNGANALRFYAQEGPINYTIAQATSNLGWESHSIFADPLFLNPSGLFNAAADFKLGPTSPARGAGYPWVGIDKDYGGYAYSKTRPSMGAWSWRGKWGGVNQPGKVGGTGNYRPK
jgi:hypothetical protein